MTTIFLTTVPRLEIIIETETATIQLPAKHLPAIAKALTAARNGTPGKIVVWHLQN